jgi:dihydropteroate synthase
MVEGGAAIIDVGGESTRPGAEPVPAEEELRRVIPVIEALTKELDVPISIDTRKPDVARSAVDAGASIINETSGEVGDPLMDEVVAETRAAIIVMHSRGTPATMQSLTHYEDVVGEVRGWLESRARALEEAGVGRDSIALDPGYGFAKTAEQSLLLLQRIGAIVDLGYPVLAGTSRKSFIGKVLNLPEDERIEGTGATVAWAVAHGASIVRVHDVAEVTRIVRMTEAILDAGGERLA